MKIVVISDCDSRKITLVNNLQGYEIAQELLHPSTFQGVFQGNAVTACDSDKLCIRPSLHYNCVCVCMHACAVGAEAIGVQATQLIGEN